MISTRIACAIASSGSTRWRTRPLPIIPGATVAIEVEESYRNMREVLQRHPEVADCARQAIERVGLAVRLKPIRGGTDGARLSFMGLPTPNLFAGEHNFHSRLEWVSAQDMDRAVAVIVELCRVWEIDGLNGN